MKPDRDILIIGGGVAGLTAAQYAARSNLGVLVLEELASGGQALLIENIENYPGMPQAVNGYELSQLFEEQAKGFGAEIRNVTAKTLRKEGNHFVVETSEGTISAYAVILATGAKHKHLGAPGEKEFIGRGVSYCATCDGPFFKDRKILVVGGGDAACDEAMFLSKLSGKVTLIHRRERFRAQKALAERTMKNTGLSIRFNTVCKEIKGSGKVERVVLQDLATGSISEEPMDAVFIFIGSEPQTQLVPDLKKDEGGYIVTDQRMETEVKGLFAVGDLRATPFRQLVVASADGAIAAHCAAQYIDDIKGEAYV
jgi:thioredoxin reductase (NADPH)